MNSVLNFIKKYYWPLIIAFFLITRLIALLNFGPHNDEMLYTQYAQQIHENWEKNWNISLDGRMYGDYKDPLQYWLTSSTVNLFKSPVFGVRLFSLLFSALGLYFLVQFIRKVFGEKEAVVAAILWISSGYYFYFDVIGLAEVYIYSLAACLLYGVYKLSLIKDWKKEGALESAVIIFLIFLSLLAKESAIVFLPVLLISPFLIKQFKKPWLYSLLLIAYFILAKFFYWFLIGSKYTGVKIKGLALTANTYSLKEALAFPLDSWLSNLNFYFSQILFGNLLFFICFFTLLISFFIYYKKVNFSFKYHGFFLLLFLASFLPAVIFLKGHTTRHYGMFLFIPYFLISIFLVKLFGYLKNNSKIKIVNLAVYAFSALFIAQTFFLIHDVVKYEATDTAVLEIGDIWASPLGVNELIEKIKVLPPGVLLYDGQWGNPGTAIQVYAKDYEQLQLAPLILNEKYLKNVYDVVSKNNGGMYLAFDLGNNKERPWAADILNNEFLCGHKIIISKGYKNILYKNTTLVLCYVGNVIK